jgi:hypothetical protein
MWLLGARKHVVTWVMHAGLCHVRTVQTQHSEGNGICTKIVSVFAATLPSDL